MERTNSRSDQIRARRSQARKTSLPISGPSRKSSRSSHSKRRPQMRLEPYDPPVMVRGATSYFPSEKTRKRRGKTRRRYDVALGVPGAEMRLPSMPIVRVGWRLVSFALVALLGFALYTLWTSPRFRVESAEIFGLERLTSSQINQALDINNRPIFTLSPGQIESQLESQFPELSSVAVQISLPASLMITVTERTPVLTWKQEGEIKLVDAEGYAFPLRSDGTTGVAEALNGPIVEASSAPPPLTPSASAPGESLNLAKLKLITGQTATSSPAKDESSAANEALAASKGQDFLDPQMVSAILELAKALPPGKPILYSDRHGLGWKDDGGWDVYVGDMKNMQMKLSVYQAMVKYLQSQEIEPAMISVEYIHAPYYRLKP